MNIEAKTYKWMEASFEGSNRCYEINPDKMRCQLNPNPYNDAWYNKNQENFYNYGADELSSQANAGKWNSEG